MTAKTRTIWTFAITSAAVFMATLDNLVVTTALPVIREDLHATVESLEWTVNAYTLTFAVLLLTGAALGDRFGRRRMLAVGLAIFTVSSAAAALAPSAGVLIAARAAQGVGGAIITPLTLTILSAGVPANRRGAFIGAWSGIAGLAVAFGPLVGGAVVSGISWHWIFWLNVPIGIVLIPLALRRLDETYGPAAKLDLPGVALASVGLTGIVWGLVRGHGQGWTSPEIVISLVAGALVFALFVLWELRTAEPMLPMRFFQNRVFTLANVASLLMFFGMFGSIFLLSQFFQTVQGYSPFGSGLRILPWTIMPMFVAPIAGALSDRIGGARLMGIGLTLQAGGLASLAAISTPFGLDPPPGGPGRSARRPARRGDPQAPSPVTRGRLHGPAAKVNTEGDRHPNRRRGVPDPDLVSRTIGRLGLEGPARRLCSGQRAGAWMLGSGTEAVRRHRCRHQLGEVRARAPR